MQNKLNWGELSSYQQLKLDKCQKSYKFSLKLGTYHVATPQQNGIVEWKHLHLLICRALLFQAKIPNIFGSHSLKLVRIMNKLYTPFLKNKSPCELVYCPNFYNLKVFCCLSYICTTTLDHTKLGFRSLKCVFLGYKS